MACITYIYNEKWVFKMTGHIATSLCNAFSNKLSCTRRMMNESGGGGGARTIKRNSEMLKPKWPRVQTRPINWMNRAKWQNVCVCVCVAKLHNFILNCFSSDETHKFSHKYFAVERIFAVKMHSMPLKLLMRAWLTFTASHKCVYEFVHGGALAFHQFKHILCHSVFYCVCNALLFFSVFFPTIYSISCLAFCRSLFVSPLLNDDIDGDGDGGCDCDNNDDEVLCTCVTSKHSTIYTH